MLRVNLPAVSGDALFDACCTGLRNSDLEGRLRSEKSNIRQQSNVYAWAGATSSLSRLQPADCQVATVTSSEMTWVYENRLAAKSSKGRVYYDAIKNAARSSLCCLCGVRDAGTLDHFLSKTGYSAFAIEPLNLLPACWDCNTGKGRSTSALIHPYFDDFNRERWLFAEVVQVRPCVVRFEIRCPPAWSPDLCARAESHFAFFGLGPLMAAQAARQLAGMRLSLRRTLASAGVEAVREDLRGDHESWADVDLNCWEAVFFEALADSDWFCAGGFDSI